MLDKTSGYDTFISTITNVLRTTTSIAININTQFFGVEADVYYPRGTGHYSGKHDDLDFNKIPDKHMRILIPDIYEQRHESLAGIVDTVTTDTYTAYVLVDEVLPLLSKIVAYSPSLGKISFLVDNISEISTNINQIYREVTLTPYVNYANNDSVAEDRELEQQYDKFIEENLLEIKNPDVSYTPLSVPLDNKPEVSGKKQDLIYKYRPIK